nr:pyridoxamine 5'-phosphate oxidase family protein [Aliamphritea spongicola]
MDIDHIRREYLQDGLSREQLAESPFEQFNTWLQQAVDAGMQDPTAMTLATVDADGQPSQRIVLLKGPMKTVLCFIPITVHAKPKTLRLIPR